jgi:molybdopterin converting factor subunit 1
MKVKVLFFGPMRDCTNIANKEYEVHESFTLANMIGFLYAEFPDAKDVLDVCSFVVNQEFTEETKPLHDGDEIAILPPVSGG